MKHPEGVKTHWTKARLAVKGAPAKQVAGLAQLVEQLICNHQAARSNRAAGTILLSKIIHRILARMALCRVRRKLTTPAMISGAKLRFDGARQSPHALCIIAQITEANPAD